MSPRIGQPWKRARYYRAPLDERLDERLAAGRKPRRRMVIGRFDGEEITAADLGRAAFTGLLLWITLVILITAGTYAGFGG